MLYPLSYEGGRTKPLVRGYEFAVSCASGSHRVILGRGLETVDGVNRQVK